ncbi:MAG: EF-Tu/IF-2/RF-3 family GTPase [Coleofasciculus sp. E1-EBD-02]
MTAHYFAGENGEQHLILPIPLNLREPAQEAREKLLDCLSMFSDGIMEKLLEGEAVPQALMWETIRKATLSLQLTPVLMGSAFKNKGVQNLLDAIALYLPSPNEREVVQAIDSQTHESVTVDCYPDNPLLALAFKITEEDTGQLTYTRLYSGTLCQGDTVKNSRTGKRVRIGRLVRMHANHRQEITEATAGDIIALIGVDCASGDTLCDLLSHLCLEGIVVPEPVVTLSIIPKHQDDVARMSKALHRSKGMTKRPSSGPVTKPDSEANIVLEAITPRLGSKSTDI